MLALAELHAGRSYGSLSDVVTAGRGRCAGTMAGEAEVAKTLTVAAKKTERPEKKIDEKAYKAALERIPDSKEKYDPWGSMRPAEPARKPK